MKVTRKVDGFVVTYEHDEKTRDAVYQAVLDWYFKHEVFAGESLVQMDEPVIDAPILLSKIADNIMGFDVAWEGV